MTPASPHRGAPIRFPAGYVDANGIVPATTARAPPVQSGEVSLAMGRRSDLIGCDIGMKAQAGSIFFE
jgi:hypothetical protein